LILTFVWVIAFVLIVIKLLPKPVTTAENTLKSLSREQKWEIPIRVIAATTLVLFVTEAASILGPQLSGLLTPFPIYISVLAASEHRINGPHSAIQLVRGATLGFFSPAVFFLIVGSTILGIGLSFGVATLVSLIIHGISLRIIRKLPDT
jgi:hypothetical protein